MLDFIQFWLEIFKIPALILFIHLNIAFIVATLRKDNSVADIAWGLGFIVVTYTAFLTKGQVTLREILSLTMVTLWALRLATHIYLRGRGRDEDFRYKKWREQWGEKALVYSYFQVFILQGFLLLVIATPLLLIHSTSGRSFWISDLLGLIIWVVGFSFESLADWQLYKFKKDPDNKGKLLTTGLWKYSRHPNYFGEVLLWWGVFLLALAHPYGLVSIIGPLAITILILKVSGIPLLEKKMEGNAEFEEYKKKTSVFVPLPPKD
ncbi:MAG: DUF1295 domain-containing protein [Patescibacteria group bacterium]|nr:DUF1295 domain-containing protein [Patescibacteria group bacterium]